MVGFGADTESVFQLYFEEKWFKKNDWIVSYSRNTFTTPPWYVRMWGFKYRFQLQVLDEPIREGTHYKYKVEYKKRMLYWFNFKVWDYEK